MLPPTITITTTTTTTKTECKCTTCGATCYKIVQQQVTSYFPDPHACRYWCYAGGPSVGNSPPPPPQVHHHHQDILALPDDSNTRRVVVTPDPSPPVGLPDYYQIMQKLKEFEPLLSDEVLALRLQLEEYKAIAKSKNGNAGRNSLFIPLPENIRNILVKARDVLNSLVDISTPPKARE